MHNAFPTAIAMMAMMMSAVHAAPPAQSRQAVTVEQFVSAVEDKIERMRVIAPVPALVCRSGTLPGARNCVSQQNHRLSLYADERDRRTRNFELTLDASESDLQRDAISVLGHICTAILMAADPRLDRRRADSLVAELTRKAANSTRGSGMGSADHRAPGDVLFSIGMVPGGNFTCGVMQDES